MQDQDIINEEERHEAATETPIVEVKDVGEGEQRSVPLAHFPSGADGTEPGGEPDYEMLTRDGFDFERLAKAMKKKVTKSIKWPEGFTYEIERNGRKLVGVIQECGAYLEDETYPYRFFATVYEGTDIVFSIDSCARGLSFQRKILKSAMHEAVMILSHMRRWRVNRAAKKGGAK